MTNEDRSQRFVINSQEKRREKYFALLMTTPSSLRGGSNLLSRHLARTSPRFRANSQEYLGQLPWEGIQGTGTFSSLDGPNIYTIDFFVMGKHICLGISRRPVHGLPERAKMTVIMKVRSCFLKLATWLSGLISFGK